MRIVADTNTIISAFLWGGPPARLLAAARAGHVTLFTSPSLVAELEDVLSRQKFAARIVSAGSSIAEMISGYLALSIVVRAVPIPRTSRDVDDDQILACAVAARADAIVSRDHDLRILGSFRGIRIMTTHEALVALGAGSK